MDQQSVDNWAAQAVKVMLERVRRAVIAEHLRLANELKR